MSTVPRILVIRSSDSETVPGEYGDTYTLDLTDLLDPNRQVTSIRVLSVHWPLICYNIITKAGFSNANMTITAGGTPYTITIEDGFYDGNTLLDTIATKFNAIMSGAYALFTNWNVNTMLVDLRLEDTLGNPVIFDIDAVPASPSADNIPSILELLGFTFTSYMGQSTYVSEGPLNVFIDRAALITCNEVRGIKTSIDHLGDEAWLEGIIAHMPFTGDVGDILVYQPENDARMINFTSSGTVRELHFNLVRDRFPFFGPTKITWSAKIEIR